MGKCAGKKNARGGKRLGGVDTTKEKGERCGGGGDAKKCPERSADEVPDNDESGRCARTSHSTNAKKAAAVGQTRCGSIGKRHFLDLTRGALLRRLGC